MSIIIKYCYCLHIIIRARKKSPLLINVHKICANKLIIYACLCIKCLIIINCNINATLKPHICPHSFEMRLLKLANVCFFAVVVTSYAHSSVEQPRSSAANSL